MEWNELTLWMVQDGIIHMSVTRKPPGNPHSSPAVLGGECELSMAAQPRIGPMLLKIMSFGRRGTTALAQTPDSQELTRHFTSNYLLPSVIRLNDI